MSPLARGRLLVAGTAVTFGLMAVLARSLSHRAGAFTAGQLSVIRFALGALLSLLAFRLRPGLHAPRRLRLLSRRPCGPGR